MLTRAFLALALVLALFGAPLQAAGPVCAMSMTASQKSQCMACCAAMKSCALPQQNPTEPTAAAASDAQGVAMILPVVPVLLRELPAASSAVCLVEKQSLALLPPRRSLFCSFLI